MSYYFQMETNSPLLSSPAEDCDINQSLVLLLRLMRLIGRINRRKDRRIHQAFEQASGISLKHFHCLYLLAHGCRQPGDLVRELGIPNSTATRLLDALEAEGLIQRLANPADLRQMQLSLTPQGRSRYETAWALYLTQLHQGFGALPLSTLQNAVAALADLEGLLTESDRSAGQST